MATLRGLSAFDEAKLIMALSVDAQMEALNTPLKVRKASLQLDYTTHTPCLRIKTPNTSSEIIATLDTRTKRVYPFIARELDNRKCNEHLQERLEKIDANLALVQDLCPKTKKRRCKLQLADKYARGIRHTLWWVYRGELGPLMDYFEPPTIGRKKNDSQE